MPKIKIIQNIVLPKLTDKGICGPSCMCDASPMGKPELLERSCVYRNRLADKAAVTGEVGMWQLQRLIILSGLLLAP